MISQWLEHITGYPQPMQQDPELSRNGNNRFLLSAFAATLSQVQPPSFQIGIGSSAADDVVRSLHQHRLQIGIALLADSQLRLALARIAAPRPQPHIAADIPTLLESILILDSEYEGQCDQWSHSAHLLQECRFRIILPGDLLDPASHCL